MARARNKLTALAVEGQSRAGRHSDGGGLYLNVTKTGSKSWVFLFPNKIQKGKKREMGLGAYPAISLANARQRAEECRQKIAHGLDPLDERGRHIQKSFGECADAYFDAMKGEWSNIKTHYKWHRALNHYCEAIRPKPISDIGTEDVLLVLNPIWQTKSETASKLRGKIERVIDYAKSRGWRTGENPARWRGHLQNILPKPKKLTHGHLPAMDYRDVPAFFDRLQQRDAMAACVLQFLILTAARSDEAFGTRWDEIDLDDRIWTVPAPRMKERIEHRVPLSDAAIGVIAPLQEVRVSEYVFPGMKPGRPLSASAMEMLLQRMKVENVTVHGFRSSFRDWCGDETQFPREVAEAALSHKVGDAVERAYRRRDALERRRALMAAWGSFCTGELAGNVVPLRSSA